MKNKYLLPEMEFTSLENELTAIFEKYQEKRNELSQIAHEYHLRQKEVKEHIRQKTRSRSASVME